MYCLNEFIGKICRSKLKVYFVFIFVYVALVDYILPPFKYFPKTSLLWESFVYLNDKFDLIRNSIIVLVAMLALMGLAFSLLYFLRGVTIKIFQLRTELLNSLRIFKFFTVFFFIGFAGMLLGKSILSELSFLFITSLGFYLVKISEAFKEAYEPYILASHGLHVEDKRIRKHVIWNGALPHLKNNIGKIYLNIWAYFLFYEFIFKLNFTGRLFRAILQYDDIAGLYASALFLWFIIALGYYAVTKIFEHYIYWEEE